MGCCNCSKKKGHKKGCSGQGPNQGYAGQGPSQGQGPGQGYAGQGPSQGQGPGNNPQMANAQSANLPAPINTQGQVNYYEDYGTINTSYAVENTNYYDNFYTKYNHYYVNDVNYVTDHYYDYNVFHYNTETVYNGTVYEGSSNIVEGNQGGCGGNNGVMPMPMNSSQPMSMPMNNNSGCGGHGGHGNQGGCCGNCGCKQHKKPCGCGWNN